MIPIVAITAAAVTVYGATSCPSAGDVSAALAAADDVETPRAATRRVELQAVGDEVVLRLQDAAGTELATRKLVRAAASCAELAQAAAVIITSWQLHPDEWTPEIPRLGPLHARAEVRHSRGSPPSLVQYEVSAAFLTSIASDGTFAVGGQATTALTRRGARFLGRISVFGTDVREDRLGFGLIAWSRVALAAGAAYRFGTTWQLELQADAIAALLVLHGSGTAGSNAFNLDPGLRAGLRGMRRLGQVAIFIETAVVGWLRSQRVNADGASDTLEVPRFEVLLAAGVAFGN
jgi:hypothetical protein